MSALKTIFRWIAWLALAVVVLAAAAWIIARATQPTSAQREAIAVLDRAPEFPGRNAFGWLWTLDRQVPPDEIDQVLAHDRHEIAAMREQFSVENFQSGPIDSATERYPDLNVAGDDRALFCGESDDSCLARIRENPEAWRELIERHRTLLDRIDALSDYGHIDQPWPYSMATHGAMRLPAEAGFAATRHALWFVDGRHEDALAATCDGISTWRRLGRNSDSLILRLLARSFAANQHGRVLAEMLAELPGDVPLPAACEAALAPPAAEQLSLCDATRGEFEIIRDSQRWIGNTNSSWWSSIGWALLYDAEASLGISAEHYARHCRDDQIDLIRADAKASGRSDDWAELSPWRLSCAGNLIGCTLFGIQWPAYDSYRLRMQDFGFKLKALATLAWLRREHPGAPVTEALLARRPEVLQSPTRQLRLGQDGESLIVPLYAPHGDSTWPLPLPGSQAPESTPDPEAAPDPAADSGSAQT